MMIRPTNEDGSSIPLILVCFLIGALMVAGVTAASSAFLYQRDLQADCDGAAIKAANAYEGGDDLATSQALPLAQKAAQKAVNDYREDVYPNDSSASMDAEVSTDVVTVECRRVVQVPFGAVFGLGDGLERTAASSARSPIL